MLSKNESFKPPEEHEEWSNSEYANILDYISEKKINYNGSIFLEWLAVPYISIWFARSTKSVSDRIWIMHNSDFTDYIVSSELKNPKEVIESFGKKWKSEDIDSLRIRNINMDREKALEKIKKYGDMLISVSNDSELWGSC